MMVSVHVLMRKSQSLHELFFSTNPKISKLVGSAVVQETNFTNLL